MIIFRKLKFQNFLSYGNSPSEVDLVSFPNTIITASNGDGKSTIIDALSFVLYGKPFRKIRLGQLVNSINRKSLEVEVDFAIGKKEYRVRRGITPNYFEIYQDGKIVTPDADMRVYQAHLEKHILGFDFKTFTQIVVLASASFVPFMQLTAQARREFIEDLLDINIFSSMSQVVKARANENKSKIEKNAALASGKQEAKFYAAQNIDLAKSETEKRKIELDEEKTKKIDELAVETAVLKSLHEEIEKLEALVAPEKKERRKYEKMLGLQSEIKTNASSHKHNYEFFEKNDNCPSCKQAITEEMKKRELEALTLKLDELKAGYEKLKEEIEKQKLKLSSLEAERSKLETSNREKSKREFRIAEITREISRLETAIKSDPSALLATNEAALKSLENELKQLTDEEAQLLDEKVLISTAQELLKDGGVKARIIKQYIPMINKIVNKYLKEMGFMISFELDETFQETIKARYRDTMSYESFSQGEKARIDLALILTWREIARSKNSVHTNLLILDEVFDGALDGSGTDNLMKIIDNLKDTNVIVISHKEGMIEKFKRILKISKKRNFSKIEEVS